MNVDTDYVDVTEVAGDEITGEQLERMCHRYTWAAQYTADKRVLELGCGVGQGLGILGRNSKKLVGSDYSKSLLKIAYSHYGERFQLVECDAQDTGFNDGSFDVILLFEAIYYLPNVKCFIEESRRLLAPGGLLLLVMANNELSDFNPSPFSHKYFSASELRDMFSTEGFDTEFFAYLRVDSVPSWQRILRPIKKLAVRFNLIPNTMGAKKLFKRIVFGRLIRMPAELSGKEAPYVSPDPVTAGENDNEHKVIYCIAKLNP